MNREYEERRIVVEAVRWWCMHRPNAFDRDEHVKNPTVNCPTAAEKDLAKAVARYLIAGDEQKSSSEHKCPAQAGNDSGKGNG